MMSRETGAAIAEDDHIRQSVGDILTTPVGSRLMRRDYGSLVPELIDQPGTPANRMRLMSATVMAVIRWEPRLEVQKASIDVDPAGRVTVVMDAIRRTGQRAGQSVNLSWPLQ